MATTFTPESKLPSRIDSPSVFLAGTIEMGNSVDWQSVVIHRLTDVDAVLFNPRRVLAPSEEDEIDYQINWELDHLQKADIIFMFLAADSVSPISLLELGLYLNAGKPLIIVCEPGYTRRQNVNITVNRTIGAISHTHLVESLDEGMNILKNYISVITCLRDAEHLIKC